MDASDHPGIDVRWAALRVAFAMVLMAACAKPAAMNHTWKDAKFRGEPPHSVLVIAVSRSPAQRQEFEDSFSQALRESGTLATPSHSLVPEEGVIPNDRIRQAISETRADGLLIARVLRVKRSEKVVSARVSPGFGGGFYKSYVAAWAAPAPSTDRGDVLTVESTLWSLWPERAVWSGTSESTDVKDYATLTTYLARLLVAKMQQDKVL